MATSTTTIHTRSSPSSHHQNECCRLSAQGVERSNEDLGSTARRLDALLSDVKDLKAWADLDQTDIVKLEQRKQELEAQLASANTQNAYLAEENRQLRQRLLQVSQFQSHLDDQDWTYVKNGPSSPRIYSGGSSSSGDAFEGYPSEMDLD